MKENPPKNNLEAKARAKARTQNDSELSGNKGLFTFRGKAQDDFEPWVEIMERNEGEGDRERPRERERERERENRK